MSSTHVGVEITEESVRAVEVTAGRSPRVIAFGEVALPPDAAKDSEIVDEGAVAVALRQLWSTARFKSRKVTLGIASRRVLVREYSTTAMPPAMLRKALPFQVQDLLPVPVDQAVLDYYPTAQHGDQLHGLLVAAVAETIEQLISAFTRTKIRVQDVDLTAFAIARAARVAAPQGAVAVIHVGDHTTQVVIMRDGIPEFVRLLPADLATAAVRRRSVVLAITDDGTPISTVKDIANTVDPARMHGDEDLSGSAGIVPRGALRGDVGSRPVSDLLARLHSTLSFYSNRPGAAVIQQILLTGAGGAVDGVHRGLQEKSQAPVRVISLPDVAAVRDAHPSGELAMNLVSTVGLALGRDS